MVNTLFDMINSLGRTHTAGIVAYKDDSVLLVRHTEKSRLPSGIYGFPAGRVERREEAIDTAIRELFEETGLVTFHQYLHPLQKRYSTIRTKSGAEKFDFQPYYCNIYSGEEKSSDKTIPEWVRLKDLGGRFLLNPDILDIAINNYEKYRIQKSMLEK
jgi:8-oxo-dGTP pyrophosphatase MutT (NUDIX family)